MPIPIHHRHIHVKHLVAAASFVSLNFAAPGCVVWEIRDEMRSANTNLADVKQTLDVANSSLDEANSRLDRVEEGLTRLDRTNTLIDSVETGLERIDTTNAELASLGKLQSIDTSLSRLDVHLAAVRKTIGSIDNMIPFLDLGGGDEYIDEAPAAGEAREVAAAGEVSDAAATAPAPSSDAAEAPPETTKAPAKREVFLGTWVEQFPSHVHAIVILSNGRYVFVAGDAPGIEGAWTHNSGVLTFTPDPVSAPPTAQTPAKAPAATPNLAPSTYSILNSSNRTLTLRDANGSLLIYGRP